MKDKTYLNKRNETILNSLPGVDKYKFVNLFIHYLSKHQLHFYTNINDSQHYSRIFTTFKLNSGAIKFEKNDIDRLVKNFNPNSFSETTPDAQYTSYSVNKGEKIVFCLRDKTDGENLVKENIMTFVAIHELGHLMTKSIGHEPEFWNTFKLLLKIAIDHGIYKNINFNSTPKEYCGVKITDTPLKL